MIDDLKRGDKVRVTVRLRNRMKTVTAKVSGVKGDAVTVLAGWMMFTLHRTQCRLVKPTNQTGQE